MSSAPQLRWTLRVERADYPQFDALEEPRLQELIDRAWSLHGGPASAVVELVWMAQEEHCRLHEQFLQDPTPTDVMAFPYGDEDLFGEVVVNLDMAIERAKELGCSPLGELELYVVHGVLHLLGFDDQEPKERERMRAAEREVLGR